MMKITQMIYEITEQMEVNNCLMEKIFEELLMLREQIHSEKTFSKETGNESSTSSSATNGAGS